jgi:hypothetical protein
MYAEECGIGGYELDYAWSGQGPVAGSCERGNEPSISTNCWEFLD